MLATSSAWSALSAVTVGWLEPKIVVVLPSTRILTFAASAAGVRTSARSTERAIELAKHESSFREGFGVWGARQVF